MSKYQMTLEEWEALAEAQGHRCAICREACALVTDHDHETGIVRGLLCMSCNTGLGKLGDSVDGLVRAVLYLLDAHLDTES